MKKLLIANRGEIAIRIARAAAELGIETVAVYSSDDARSLHRVSTDQAYPLNGIGPAAYLDQEQIITIAKAADCDAIHPGYGFLSENATFAKMCLEEGLKFIGPRPEMLELFGDKIEARLHARRCGVPLLRGTQGATSLEEARDFFISLGPDGAIMIKAVMGGGGRGMRAVYNLTELTATYERCRSEARMSFGLDDVYVEQLIRKPRHIEVQVVGDGKQVIHLGERECTMQRRNQKLIEVAPCPTISTHLRDKMRESALKITREACFDGLGTVEFLVEGDATEDAMFAFLEVNPRLQVEHTVTEEVTGIDLVTTQIQLADGKMLTDLGLTQNLPRTHSYAMQLRINMEEIDSTGSAHATGGTISVYEVPSGPGIRVDGYGYSGYTANPAYDSLLAKLIVTTRSPRFESLVAKAYRALRDFRVEGVITNIPFLLNLLRNPKVIANEIHTQFIAENANLLTPSKPPKNTFFFQTAVDGPNDLPDARSAPEGTVPVEAPMLGRIISINVGAGDSVALGQTIAIMEAMKMEYEIQASRSGYVKVMCAGLNDIIPEGAPILYLEEAEIADISAAVYEATDLTAIRPDLAEVMARHAFGLDVNRPEAVAGRHNKGHRTARENVEDLCDPESFIEYGALTIAAQRRRRPLDELIRKTPGDGLIAGIGSINGSSFGEADSRCLVMAYDYTVLAGTQGHMNHKKMDRMLQIAHEWRLPTVLFAEGGGGRPGDTDVNGVTGLDLTTFSRFAGLGGKAPLVGITSGFCFAGNAALLGCCDVIIATKHSYIGMGGPAMIEGGGLGSVRPEDIGPLDIQSQNGVVDIAVADEAEAVSIAKKYLSYFQGAVPQWDTSDQRLLRHLIPENRLRVYDIRAIIEVLADTNSVLELRPLFGKGIITALIRIEGRPFGLIANNPKHVSGAIEAQDADKAARFLQLCNVHGIPILSLIDTPGFMVGPDIEKEAQVRHVSRMFMIGSHLNVPFFAVILRKGYGLGAMAMSAGGFHDSFFTAAWPTGEFGPMGLEGAVKHGYRKELESIEDLAERDAAFKQYVAEAYKMGKAINIASYLEIDAVIDPADTRRWVMRGLKSMPRIEKNTRSFIDTW